METQKVSLDTDTQDNVYILHYIYTLYMNSGCVLECRHTYITLVTVGN